MAISIDPANARLSKVQAAGIGDTYEGDAGAAGGEKWHGNAGVYYDTRRERVTTGEGASNIVIRHTLTVSGDLPIAWAAGDVVTFTPRRRDAITGTVKAVDDTPPEPGEAGEVLLDLELQ